MLGLDNRNESRAAMVYNFIAYISWKAHCVAPLKITTLNEPTMKLKIDFYSSEEHVSETVSQKQQLGKNTNRHSDGACFSARKCMV